MSEVRHGRTFWTFAAIGWAVMIFGIAGAFSSRSRSAPGEMAAWILGMALVHDLVLAPLVFGAGITLRRAVPSRARAAIQGAFIATGILVVYSFPLLRGYGRRPSNPTIQPNNYALGFAVVAGIVWAVSALVLIRAMRRRT